MRRVRLTYEGPFHHGMNRGIDGEDIFEGNQNKAFCLDGGQRFADYRNAVW